MSEKIKKVIKSLADEKMIVFECPLEDKRYDEFKDKVDEKDKGFLKYFEGIPKGLIRIFFFDTLDDIYDIYKIEILSLE